VAEHLRSLDDFRGIDLDGNSLEPLQLISENRVVLFTWFAEWCENCRYEAPELARIEQRWAESGFAAVARSEYSHPDVVREFREEFDIEYPILLGSANPDPENEDGVRIATEHYRLRKALGDTRKWGTPLSLLVVDGDIEAPYVVLGEAVPSVLEWFLEDHLGPRVQESLADGGSSVGASS
jgi:thiol-disulfide isomerase/thioredoxin